FDGDTEVGTFVDGVFVVADVPAGDYLWTVVDDNGCIDIVEFTLTQPLLLEAAWDADPILCYGDVVDVTVTATGGTTPIMLFDGDTEVGTFVDGVFVVADVPAGDYLWTVVDDNGCVDIVEFTLTQPPLLEAEVISQTDASCFGYNDGAAVIEVTGGTPPYTASVGDVVANMITLSDLAAGDYTVVITDALGCLFTVEVTITEPVELEVVATSVDVLCNPATPGSVDGDCFGFAILDFDQGLASYDKPVPPERSIPELALGEPSMDNSPGEFVSLGFGGSIVMMFEQPIMNGEGHDLMVYESSFGDPDCAEHPEYVAAYAALEYEGDDTEWVYLGKECQNASFDLGELPYAQFIMLVDVSDPDDFSGDHDGYDVDGIVCLNGYQAPTVAFLTVETIIGGTPGYDLAWQQYVDGVWVDLGVGEAMLTDITEGIYQVVVTDANGCTAVSEQLTITIPDPIVAVPVFEAPDCYVESVAVTVDASGGTGDLMLYDLVGDELVFVSALPLAEPIDLVTGGYNWVIVDENGCQFLLEFDIYIPAPLMVEWEFDPILCFGATTDVLVTGTGGTGMLNLYAIAGEELIPVGPLPQTVPVAAGTFNWVVIDENGCEFFIEDVVVQPDELVVTPVELSHPVCPSGTDGYAVYEISGGTPPYTSTIGVIDGNILTIPDLGEGHYVAHITDLYNCGPVEVIFELVDPDPIVISVIEVIDVMCYDTNTGSIEVLAVGGNDGLMYSLDGVVYQETGLFENLGAGVYTIYVRDALGCIAMLEDIVVIEPEELVVTLEVDHVSCFGADDGQITGYITGGVGPYQVCLFPYCTDDIGKGDFSAAKSQGVGYWDLEPGQYTVAVVDQNGCIYTECVTIAEPPALTLDLEVENLVCEGVAEEIFVADWIWYRQGLTKLATSPNTDRSDPDQVIGEPAYGDTPGTFFSLGYGGEMIVMMDAPFVNGPDDDLLLVESSYNDETCDTYPEMVDVWVAQTITESLYAPLLGELDILTLGDEWVYIGRGCLDDGFDLGEMPWAQYVYLKDVSDPAEFPDAQDQDGFDIDGLVAVYGSMTATADLIAIPGGGTPPYTYLWNTGEVTQQITSGMGTFSVVVTDAMGCMIEESIVVICTEVVFPTSEPLTDNLIDDGDSQVSLRAYPNPFRREATIEFELQKAGDVSLEVYNMVGERIATLFEGRVEAHIKQQATLKAGELPDGVYFYRLNTPNKSYINKLILTK
ncbi:MAG: T9SS type A sorting domain-containing protein, partial [Bacteroidales bacterium]